MTPIGMNSATQKFWARNHTQQPMRKVAVSYAHISRTMYKYAIIRINDDQLWCVVLKLGSESEERKVNEEIKPTNVYISWAPTVLL